MPGPATILIVDDEPNNVDYLEQELAGFGYTTVSASNGAEALAIVAATPPALILLDVMMPVMNGFKTCSILKAADETRFIPVIIMTALDAVEDRVSGIKAGADDFLTKPVDERELLARIETSLRLKEAMDRKVEGLRRLRDHFAKFVPSAVRDLVAQNPEAPDFAKQERDASILFLDITGYARLSELLPPSTLNELIERYFSAFLDEVTERGGSVNETMGDGFMAIFQQPNPMQNAAAATETALGVFAATERINRDSKEQPIEVHIGISSGKALVGSTQFHGRHGTRWVFSASGRHVNVAARLASIAQSGQIFVSSATRYRLGDHYIVESEGTRKLKNIEEEVETFRVVRRVLTTHRRLRYARPERARPYSTGCTPGNQFRNGLLRTVASAAGIKPILLPVPFAAWQALARIAEMFPSPPITRNQVELMQIDSTSSPDMPGIGEIWNLPRSIEEILQDILI